MNNYIFNTTDKSGKEIHLTKERWTHICEHKGMDKYLEEIKETIQKPIKIISHEEGKLYDYYKYHKHRESKNKFLQVVVKYLNGQGFVLSAYFVPHITY